MGGGVSTIEVTVPVEVTIPVEVTVPGETVTIAGDTVTVTIAGEPVTVTVQGEPTTVTVEAEPVTVTVEAEPTTVTVQAEPKTNPTFSLGKWAGSNNTYSAVVSYNGDGVLTANTGTLSGSTITVSDEDGNFSGVISAAEGTNFAPANLAFTHSKETVGGGSGKLVPILSVEDNEDYTGTITYNGDGTLTAYCGYSAGGNYDYTLTPLYIGGNIVSLAESSQDSRTGVIFASEGEKYSPAWATFVITGSGPC